MLFQSELAHKLFKRALSMFFFLLVVCWLCVADVIYPTATTVYIYSISIYPTIIVHCALCLTMLTCFGWFFPLLGWVLVLLLYWFCIYILGAKPTSIWNIFLVVFCVLLGMSRGAGRSEWKKYIKCGPKFLHWWMAMRLDELYYVWHIYWILLMYQNSGKNSGNRKNINWHRTNLER